MANDILKFAEDGTTADLLTQAEYAADPQRLIGNQPGIARQKLVNKVLRQCAYISNAFAEYIISKVGGDILDDDDSAGLLAKITAAFTYTFTNQNYVINGNMDFWQRNFTSVTVSASNTYTADRWVGVMTGSTSIVARQATALTEAFNARYFLRAAVTSVANASNFNQLAQRIENVRVLAGKTVTLSFYAKADSSRNMSIEFVQNFGTGGSPSADVNALGVQKLALTTSWQKFTKTVTLPSITGKVIGSNANSYLAINFWFDAGSAYNARTDSLGQQSGTFDIAQVKLEQGINATDFILAGGTLDGELKACQRYYEKSFPPEVNPGTATGDGQSSGKAAVSSQSVTEINLPFKAQKRTAPTVTWYSPTTGAVDRIRTSDGTDRTVTSTSNPGTWNTGFANLTAVYNGVNSFAQFTADAEL